MKKAKKNPCVVDEKYFSSNRVAELPRFVSWENNTFCWDESKICVAFTEEEKQDPLFLVNVFTGSLVCSRALPLIWDSGNERSLAALKAVLKEGTLGELVEESRTMFNVALRDLFFASSRKLLNPDEQKLFEELVETANEDQPLLDVQGLSISFYPTARFKLVRFFELESDSELIASVAGVRMGFVNTSELHFRTFENIIPLDRAFRGSKLSLSMTKAKVLSKEGVYSSSLSGSSCEHLLSLDKLGFYVEPLNSTSRGGLRFIFSSVVLADKLSELIRGAAMPCITDSFVGVNPGNEKERKGQEFEEEDSLLKRDLAWKKENGFGCKMFLQKVFRMNHFDAGAAKGFEEHLDTPYFDRSRRCVSRFSLLIYLTGGSCEKGALSFERSYKLTTIEDMTVVVFDQSLRHSGCSYDSTTKLFLRSELIFQMSDLEATESNASIGALFAKAVYMTKEVVISDSDVFARELGSAHHDLYDAVSAAHFGKKETKQPPKGVFFHKTFDNNHYLSNGFDFFFSNKAQTWDFTRCCAIVLLDFFNAIYEKRPFASVCRSKVVRLKRDTVEEVFMYLDSLKYATEESSSLFGTWSSLDREVLFPELPELPERKKDEEQDADAPREVCCPFHFMPKRFVEEFGDDVDDVWDPTRNNEAIRVLNGCNRFLKQLLFSAPVTIMGSEIKLSKESFVVRGNHVHVLANEKMSPVNFASCWNGVDLHHVVDSDSTKPFRALFPVVPPLLFYQHSNGLLRINLDFFRNDWMIDGSKQLVGHFPKFSDLDEEIEEGTFEHTWFGDLGYDDEFPGILYDDDAAAIGKNLMGEPPPLQEIQGSISIPK